MRTLPLSAMSRRMIVRGILGLVAAVLLAGCSGGPGPGPSLSAEPSARPVTQDEAELLAVTRFRNFDAGTRAVRATFDDRGHEVQVVGWMDYTTHTGYGQVLADGSATDRIVWDGGTIAMTSAESPDAPVGDPPESVSGWTVAQLDPTASRISSLLAVLAALGADRPENPLLLRQGGALWLAEQEVAGEDVTVFAGPTAEDEAGTRYWLDDTGLAHRVEVRLGDGWADVRMSDGGEVRVPAVLPDLAPPAEDAPSSGSGAAR